MKVADDLSFGGTDLQIGMALPELVHFVLRPYQIQILCFAKSGYIRASKLILTQ